MMIADKFEFWRKQMQETQEKRRPFGHRHEEQFPVRLATAGELDIRDNSVLDDITDIPLAGIDDLTPP